MNPAALRVLPLLTVFFFWPVHALSDITLDKIGVETQLAKQHAHSISKSLNYQAGGLGDALAPSIGGDGAAGASVETDTVDIDIRVTPQIAIIIDDLGYSLGSGKALAALPYPITFAVIPNSPHARAVADLALNAEHELILHVPMQTQNRKHWEDGLNVEQDRDVFDSTLADMLADYPNIRGINNHGGSLLTADAERMGWVMEMLAKNDLFFLDSRTTNMSQAITEAEKRAVPHLSRDVFLDNERSQEAVSASFDRLRNIALKHGKAVGIGHPHRVTLAQLNEQLPKLVEEGFDLRYSSELIEGNLEGVAQQDRESAESLILTEPEPDHTLPIYRY